MFPRFVHPFLAYRSFLFPILVLSSIVVPCWLAFRLYRHRRSAHPPSFGREILLLAFVIYLSGLAAVTLAPNHGPRARSKATAGIGLRPDPASLTCSSAILPRGSDRGFCARNARGNVMLFFPLGILIPLVWRRLRFWRGIQIAIGISIGIELTQYLSRAWGSHRSPDVNDVILNGLGACLGLAVVFLPRMLRRTRVRSDPEEERTLAS